MSYELKIDPKKRAAGRFIGAVRKALISAALQEKEERGLSQQKVADCLGVNRSVINRMLRGETNLTLRSVAEIAWAMGWEPRFHLVRRHAGSLSNHEEAKAPYLKHFRYPATSAAPVIVTYNAEADKSHATKNYIAVAAE